MVTDVRALNRTTPRWFQLVPQLDGPAKLALGVTILYKMRWRGISMSWQSLIREWQPPTAVGYRQVRGPFRYFRHEYRLREGSGGTHLRESVRYSVPGGAIIARLLVQPDLERIFAYRARFLAAIESGSLLGGSADQ